jgi:hypothetical protein
MKWLFAFVILFGVNTAVFAESETVNLKTLIDQFNSVVFIHEHGKTGREAKPLVKWKGPIIYSPSGTLQKKDAVHFFNLMKQVQALTKLDMRMPKQGEKTNLTVYYKPQAELAKELEQGINCKGTMTVNKESFYITGAKAYVPSDRPDKTAHCTVEETVQLFGLTNDSTVLENSMFNENSKRESLSITDQILLKALYDPRLKTGMSKEEAQPILKVILSEIIQKASKKKKT